MMIRSFRVVCNSVLPVGADSARGHEFQVDSRIVSSPFCNCDANVSTRPPAVGEATSFRCERSRRAPRHGHCTDREERHAPAWPTNGNHFSAKEIIMESATRTKWEGRWDQLKGRVKHL